MIKSYQRVLDMESVALLKLEQDRKALNSIKNILYIDKTLFTEKLIIYLKRELNIDYYKYSVIDVDGNVADILVKKDSKIFKEKILDQDYLNFNIEDLIDSRIYKNKDEIIIIDLSFDTKLINLAYLSDSLNYNYLSYSNLVKEILSTFVDYVLNKNIYKNKNKKRRYF